MAVQLASQLIQCRQNITGQAEGKEFGDARGAWGRVAFRSLGGGCAGDEVPPLAGRRVGKESVGRPAAGRPQVDVIASFIRTNLAGDPGQRRSSLQKK